MNEIGRYTPKQYIDSEVDADEGEIPEKRTILAPEGAVFPDGFDLTPIPGDTIMDKLTAAQAVPSGNLLVTVVDADLEFVIHNLPTFVGLNLVLYMDAPAMEYSRAWYLKATTLPSITPQEIEHEVKLARAKARPKRPEQEPSAFNSRRKPFAEKTPAKQASTDVAFQDPPGLDDTDED